MKIIGSRDIMDLQASGSGAFLPSSSGGICAADPDILADRSVQDTRAHRSRRNDIEIIDSSSCTAGVLAAHIIQQLKKAVDVSALQNYIAVVIKDCPFLIAMPNQSSNRLLVRQLLNLIAKVTFKIQNWSLLFYQPFG